MTTIPENANFLNCRFLRGIAGLIDSMRLYKSLMLLFDKAVEAGEVEEEPSKFENGLTKNSATNLLK